MKKINPNKGFDGKAYKKKMAKQCPNGQSPPPRFPKQPYLPRGYITPSFAIKDGWDRPSRSLSPIARDLGEIGETKNMPDPVYIPPPQIPIHCPGNINEINDNARLLRSKADLLKKLTSRPKEEYLEIAKGRPCLCIVTGTYNRLGSLRNAVQSIRNASAGVYYKIVAIDGGSDDGTQKWVEKQKDIHLIRQSGPLTGAVKAFNLGFSWAVEEGFPYVMHFNDDAEIVTPDALIKAINIMQKHQFVGEVAFAFDLRGGYGFDLIHGKPYANFGIVRRQAGMMAAIAQGDGSGKKWWNEIYRTYGADTEFGCWLWKLGWTVFADDTLHVHDTNVKDHLREVNESCIPQRKDSRLFWQRWPTEETIEP